MEMNHKALSKIDKLWVLSELEHKRRHARRSSHVAESNEDKMFYKVVSARSQDIRRRYQQKYFPDVTELDWCLLKVSETLRQLNYEATPEDDGLFDEIEDLCDMVTSHAIHEDVSGCKSCAEDRADVV